MYTRTRPGNVTVRFEFTSLEGGDVEVVNQSHEEPDEHTYTVHVEGGIPSDCTCPAFEYQEDACKHVRCDDSRAGSRRSDGRPTLKADGGVTVEAGESNHSDERPDDCDCGEWNERLGLPCWPCYRVGFEEPAEVSEE